MRYEQRLQNESTSAYPCFERGFHILFDLGIQHVVNETPTAPERQVDFPTLALQFCMAIVGWPPLSLPKKVEMEFLPVEY